MHFDEPRLLSHLDDLGIPATTVRHPAVYTVAENKELRGQLPGAHVKNLFLKDRKQKFWLVTALEDRAIDLKALRRQLGANSLSFAGPDYLAKLLGVEPGSVTPLAAINDREGVVQVVLDQALMAAAVINVHPLVNTATTAIGAADLVRFLESCGHSPLILDLGNPPEAI